MCRGGLDALLPDLKRARDQARQALLGQEPVLPLAPGVAGRDPDPPLGVEPGRQPQRDTG